jgi:hypothetical protein
MLTYYVHTKRLELLPNKSRNEQGLTEKESEFAKALTANRCCMSAAGDQFGKTHVTADIAIRLGQDACSVEVIYDPPTPLGAQQPLTRCVLLI